MTSNVKDIYFEGPGSGRWANVLISHSQSSVSRRRQHSVMLTCGGQWPRHCQSMDSSKWLSTCVLRYFHVVLLGCLFSSCASHRQFNVMYSTMQQGPDATMQCF